MKTQEHSVVSNILPQRDHILLAIEKPKTDNKTQSGIFLVNKPQQTVNTIGTVISTGNGRYTQTGTKVPVEVNQGDKVIFYEYSGILIEETEDYFYKLLKENDIIAIITK